MTDIEAVRALTGNTEISDDFIAFYLDSTEKLIKSYCHIDAIPDGLKPTLIEMTALRVNANSEGSQAALGKGVQQVGSVSDGNQSVSYVTGSTGGKSFISEEDLISSFSYVLDSFRRLPVSRPTCFRGARKLHGGKW